MLSIQKISKAAAKGYAEYIAEQEEHVAQIVADDPTVSKEEAARRAARAVVARVADREGEDVEEALRQFDKRADAAQVGPQVGYYSPADNDVKAGDRLVHVAGDRTGEAASAEDLTNMLLMRDGNGHRIDDAHPKQIRALAREVGLTEPPTAEQMGFLRKGLDPTSGEELVGKAAQMYDRAWSAQALRDKAVTGVDLTFSAPKSLSIYAAAAAASGDMERYETVLQGLETSISNTLKQAQDEGLICARRGKDGAERIAAELTDGVVKVETGSRAKDPQLHGHTVLSSVVQGEDGHRTQLDAQVVFNSSKYLGAIFRRHLATQMSKELGLQFTVDEVGMHELVGFSEDLIEKYSKRSSEIAETLSEMDAADEALRNAVAIDRDGHRTAFEKQSRGEKLESGEKQKAKTYGKFLKLEGQSDAARRQEATVQSRRGKDGTEAELIEHWKKDETLSKLLVQYVEGRAKVADLSSGFRESITGQVDEMTEEQLAEFVGQHLTVIDGQQSFSEKEARIAYAQFAPPSWSPEKLQEEAQKFLNSPDHVVRLQVDEMSAPRLASWTNDVPRYSTPSVVAVQQRIMKNAAVLADRTPKQPFDHARLAELADSYTLTEQQEEFNAAIAATDLTVARGYAGTGKSHALKPACEALQEQGYEVSVFCVKKGGAYELYQELGANRGESLTKLLMREGDNGLPHSGLIEAGKWAQGESEDVREERRLLEKNVREAGNRARAANAQVDMDGREEAEVEQAAAQKELDAFTQERAADLSAQEVSNAWDVHLEAIEKAKRMPRGRERQQTLEKLAERSRSLGESADFAPDAKEAIDWSKKHCWFIDEAGLMTDEQLERLTEIAAERGVKLVFLGDREQGKAIGISGGYSRMEDAYGSVSLTEIQRAKAEWERDLQVRFHDLPRETEAAKEASREIVAEYEEHDRIQYITEESVSESVAKGDHDADDKRVASKLGIEQAADWYMAHREEGKTASVQTSTRQEQAAVAEAVQEKLIESGELKEGAKSATLHLDKQTTLQGRVGEPILIRHNINKKGLRNGMSGEITAIHKDGSIKVRVQDGEKSLTQTVSRDELKKDFAVSLLYASTVAKEQGSTFDHAAVLVPADGSPMSKGDLYTAMTRGRYENTAIVATSKSKDSARDHLARSIENRQEDKALTIDYVNGPLTRAEVNEEERYGTPPEEVRANIVAQRKMDYNKQQEQKAAQQKRRRKAETSHARRLRYERERREEKQTKEMQHSRSRVRMR